MRLRLHTRATLAATLLALVPLAWAQAQAPDADGPGGPADPWALSALYTHSDLGSGRDDWQQLDLDLYYTPDRQWVVTGGVDMRRRGDATDAIYGVGAEYYTGAWRLHGAAAATPGADFSYERGYVLGADWRATPWLSLLLDMRRYEFPTGDLREVRPGATLWFNDDATALTARYTDGDAFDGTRYDAFSLRLDQALPRDHRLSLVYANGTDPERDPALPGVLLSEADFYAAYYRVPLRAGGPAMLFGLEYEDRDGAWTRTGVSIGLVARF